MSNVRPVPEGYHTVTPFLNINGAAEAIEFYKKAFGAAERYRMPGPNGKIMHAEIQIGDSAIMISDVMMNAPTQSSLHVYVEDARALWKRATDAGCEVAQPLVDQFWGDRWGVLTDKFGNRWSIAQHIEDVGPDEMQKRAAEAMKNMK
jgi:PhnB protein